jgi:hypothetical protein
MNDHPVDLTAEESAVFVLGKSRTAPDPIRRGSGYCFHRCVYFLTGDIPDLPPWPKYAPDPPEGQSIKAYIASHGERLGIKKPLFDYERVNDTMPLHTLTNLGSESYLIQLLDQNECKGHWVALKDTKIFDPGYPEEGGTEDIPVSDWTRAFRNRYVIRRIFPVR